MKQIGIAAILLGLGACQLFSVPPNEQPPDQTAAYIRDMDTFLTCANGGMVEAVFEQPIVYGRYARLVNGGIGTVGATGAFKFEMSEREDGALTGDNGVWFPTSLPADADRQCAALEQQPWWSMPPVGLPTPTAFESPLFDSLDDCNAAKAAGTYPDVDRCDLELLVCPSGTAYGLTGDVIDQTTYALDHGSALVTGLQEGAFEITLYADGTLSPLTDEEPALYPWTSVDPGEVAADLGCP